MFTACHVHRQSGLWQVEKALGQWFRCWQLPVSLARLKWSKLGVYGQSTDDICLCDGDEGGTQHVWEMKRQYRWLNVGTSLSGKKRHCASACLYAHFNTLSNRLGLILASANESFYFPEISSVQIPSLGPGWVLCTHVCSLDLRLCCSLFQTPFLECCAHLSQQAWSEAIYSLQPAGSLSSYDSAVTQT